MFTGTSRKNVKNRADWDRDDRFETGVDHDQRYPLAEPVAQPMPGS